MPAFLFERDFDQEMEAEKRSVTPEEGPRMFSVEEVEELRQKAFEEGRAEGEAAGFAAGEAEALASIHAVQTETLRELSPLVAAIRAEQGQYNRAREHDLLQLVLFLAQAVLPEVEERFGRRRIEAFCRRALKMAEGDQGLEIFLSPQMHEELSEAFRGTTTAEGAPLRLLADPELPVLGARAQWASGSADYAAERLRTELLTTLQSLAQSTAPDGTRA